MEGYHAGLIRTVLYESQANSTSLGEDVLDTVADFGLLRGIVGAGSGQGLVVDDESNLAAADSDGLAFLRVPGQVGSCLLPHALCPPACSNASKSRLSSTTSFESYHPAVCCSTWQLTGRLSL